MSNIQVIVDGIVFENNYQIGVWRIFYETMRRTSKDIQYTLLLSNRPRQPVPEGVRVEQSHHRASAGRSEVVKRLRRKIDRQRLSHRDRDAIWHSTFFSVDPGEGRRNVVTVYDMIAERHFHLGTDSLTTQHYQKYDAISRANRILAISKSTAADISRFFPDSCADISVIPLGAEHIEVARPKANDTSSKPYVLFVGNRSSYKNYVVVLEALASTSWPEDLSMKVVGAPFSDMENSLHDYFHLSRKIQHVGRVCDAELSKLYQTATCFIFPSLAEGFGFPLVEAQANECLAVVSDIPVFHEVGGEGALFFDPGDPASLCEAIRKASDTKHRNRVLAAAKENSARFSWDDTAEAVARVYESIY